MTRLESAGVVVRVPDTWRANRPSRPQVTATLGGKPPSGPGKDALLDFRMEVTLDGERLPAAEIAPLLAASDGLHLVRGRWVEVDRVKLASMLDEFRRVERTAKETGLTFVEAMRLLAGANISAPPWHRRARLVGIVAGPWLAKTLDALRHPDAIARIDHSDALRTSLRRYQQAGLPWLHLLSSLGFGACLADDMGLDKTMQVLALLLILRKAGGADRRPTSILVALASLVANWKSEIARFAPDLRTLIAHQVELLEVPFRAPGYLNAVCHACGAAAQRPAEPAWCGLPSRPLPSRNEHSAIGRSGALRRWSTRHAQPRHVGASRSRRRAVCLPARAKWTTYVDVALCGTSRSQRNRTVCLRAVGRGAVDLGAIPIPSPSTSTLPSSRVIALCPSLSDVLVQTPIPGRGRRSPASSPHRGSLRCADSDPFRARQSEGHRRVRTLWLEETLPATAGPHC